MEATDYVSYELAVKLKACGFDEPCDHCCLISKDTNTYVGIAEYPAEQKWNSAKIGGPAYLYKHISAPTLWQAQKWLLNNKHLYVEVSCDKNDGWFCGVKTIPECNIKCFGSHYESYEYALSVGISAALELIKEGV